MHRVFKNKYPFVIKVSKHKAMKKKYTIEEIKKKLQWFHGEEFDKYPFIDNANNIDSAIGSK